MILAVEAIVLCALFTLMVIIIAREPIKTLYNYPPKIQERVKSLDAYKNQIPTEENKVVAKIGASILFVVILSLLMRYVNGCTTFGQAFGYGFLLWTIVNLWDVIVLDSLQSPMEKNGRNPTAKSADITNLTINSKFQTARLINI